MTWTRIEMEKSWSLSRGIGSLERFRTKQCNKYKVRSHLNWTHRCHWMVTWPGTSKRCLGLQEFIGLGFSWPVKPNWYKTRNHHATHSMVISGPKSHFSAPKGNLQSQPRPSCRCKVDAATLSQRQWPIPTSPHHPFSLLVDRWELGPKRMRLPRNAHARTCE